MAERPTRRAFLAATAGGAGFAAALPGSSARGDELPDATMGESSPPAVPFRLSVADFGARLDGVADDTDAVEAAIEAAQEHFLYLGDRKGNASVPEVVFPPGECLITRTLFWKSCSLVGLDPGISSGILWGGSNGGGPALKMPRGYAGGGWVGRLEGISFEPANLARQPGSWLVIDESVDKFLLLRRVRFRDCRSDAIKLTRGWINLHWEHLRWDNTSGYAIRADAMRGQHLSSFRIENFTYDHSVEASPCEGFLLIDNKFNQTNLGTVSIGGARLEINQPWAGKRALVTYRQPRKPYPKTLGLLLHDIDYQDGVGMRDDCLLYLDSKDPGRESLVIINSRVTGLGKVLGGNWPDGHVMPELPKGGAFAMTIINAGEFMAINDPLALRYSIKQAAQPAISIAHEGDNVDRLQLDSDGRIRMSDGRGESDTILYRAAPSTLRTDGRLVAAGGIGVGNAQSIEGSGDVTGKIEVFNAEGNSLGFLVVYRDIG